MTSELKKNRKANSANFESLRELIQGTVDDDDVNESRVVERNVNPRNDKREREVVMKKFKIN